MVTLLLAALFAVVIEPTTSTSSNEVTALIFLEKYGYINETEMNMVGAAAAIEEGALTESLKEFQRFAGLKPTGKLDSATLVKMRSPRCGVKDKIGSYKSSRYNLQGSMWRGRVISYKIRKYSRKLWNRAVRETIARAFKMWSDVTDLKFVDKKRYGRAHIDISFEIRHHGDDDAFDGPGNTLAHAFFPQYGGDAHFDDEEDWKIEGSHGINLLQVATHEFGHSLGLLHSDNGDALMAPYYKSSGSYFQLHWDDKAAIQRLYGTRDNGRKRYRWTKRSIKANEDLSPASNISGVTDLCTDTSIDTITKTNDGNTYIFKGDFYWKISPEGIADGYPRRIQEDWDGMPGSLDASVTKSNGKTYFFKGKDYWRFTNKSLEPGYPKLIETEFKGIPESLDAAFESSRNDAIYFFKGGKFWLFENADQPVSNQYPKPINHWKGLPDRFDAAFRSENGSLYVFKDDQYYQLNEKAFGLEAGDPPCPRSTSKWWFGCG